MKRLVEKIEGSRNGRNGVRAWAGEFSGMTMNAGGSRKNPGGGIPITTLDGEQGTQIHREDLSGFIRDLTEEEVATFRANGWVHVPGFVAP
jgi:hypothetical protein